MATVPVPPDYCAMLAKAEAAYDNWINGNGIVEFQDQNGERVKKGPANLDRLAARIAELRRLCNPSAAYARRTRAIGFTF